MQIVVLSLCVLLFPGLIQCIGVQQFCPHALERLRFCRRSEYTIEDLDSLRMKTPETDAKLLQDIEKVINGIESSTTNPQTLFAPSAIESVGSVVAEPSPYAAFELPVVHQPVAETAPVAEAAPQVAETEETRDGRSIFVGKRRKKKLLVDILGKWVLEEDLLNTRGTSRTARIVGKISGDLIGLLVAEKFRSMGQLAGSIARRGVKDIATGAVDSIIRVIHVS